MSRGIFKAIAACRIDGYVIPFMVIGDNYTNTQGFNEAISEELVETALAAYQDENYVDLVRQLAKNHDDVPAGVKEHYNNLKFNATDCIACGDCEPRCPFDVHIVDVMLDAQDLFGF